MEETTEQMQEGTFVEVARWCLKVCGADTASEIVATLVMIVLSTIFAVSLYWIARLILFNVVARLVAKSRNKWDDHLFNKVVLERAAYLASISSMVGFGVAMQADNWLHTFYMKVVGLYSIFSVGRFVLAVLTALFSLLTIKYPKARSMNSLKQLVTWILIALMVIVMVSIVFDKDPSSLIAGLGASAALVSLIFKETIASLLSGIQLSANNMLSPGDWVSVSKAGADGIVEEVGLNTVKIRNWDNTITTIPPSTLMSDSFVNYKGMQEGAGRRIARSILVEVASIRFLTVEEEMKYATWPELNLFFQNRNKSDLGGQLTNLTLYREYMLSVLERSQLIVAPNTATNMTIMVRTLAQNSYGALPVEAYCFSKTKVWAQYEKVLADVVNHMAASLPLFDLSPYSRNKITREQPDVRPYHPQQQLLEGPNPAELKG